ncbi:MAG: hypothetical protein M1825_000670 [Sarcosagium campestre]|nr:MAG: hypothetical protein M1825_000670 [Sarcosagium campestre]
MFSIYSLLLATVAAGIAAAGKQSPLASVYTDFDADHRADDSTSLNPEALRLIVSQRLGISQFHSVEHADHQTIRQLNDFGLFTQLLAEKDERDDLAVITKTLIFVEGVKDATEIIPTSSLTPTFRMTDPPSPAQNDKLAQDLVSQLVLSLGTYRTCISHMPRKYTDSWMPEFVDLEIMRQNGQAYWCSNGKTLVVYISALDKISKSSGFSSVEYKDASAAISRAIASVTPKNRIAVLYPPSNSGSQSSDNPYGVYTVPQDPKNSQAAGLELARRSASPEKSASAPPRTPPASLLRLPPCFTTLNACISATSGCSDHGECKLKYTSPRPEPNQAGKPCFACVCVPTVIRDIETHPKTTYWGGGACQKKDVSAPFWLLAGFSVFLMSLVGWSIGLMFSIGEETLPSVLGAGVGGAKPR